MQCTYWERRQTCQKIPDHGKCLAIFLNHHKGFQSLWGQCFANKAYTYPDRHVHTTNHEVYSDSSMIDLRSVVQAPQVRSDWDSNS